MRNLNIDTRHARNNKSVDTSQIQSQDSSFSEKFENENGVSPVRRLQNVVKKQLSSNFALEMESIQENSENSNSDIGSNTSNVINNSSISMSVKDVANLARNRLLSIQMQKKESIKHMKTLRKVHDSKLKLQKKMLNKIANDMSTNRVDVLKKMFHEEMEYFFQQYDDLLEINQRQVHNENEIINVSESPFTNS